VKRVFLPTLVTLLFLTQSCSTISSAPTDRAPKATLVWETSTNIDTPESVYFDEDSATIFISNIAGEGTKKDGKGWITVLDKTGQTLNAIWYKGLNAPKGMRAYNGSLWVTDIDEILEIEIKSAKLKNKFKIKEAKFLNDVAIDKRNGDVYVSDTIGDTVYKVSEGKVKPFITAKTLVSPNGLLVINDYLLIASWGDRIDGGWETTNGGDLYEFNLSHEKIENTYIRGLGNLDGLEIYKEGNFLITDWSTGQLHYVTSEGKNFEVLGGFKGSADIAYIEATNTVIIPRMGENKVSAYKLDTQ
jgi:hypothetical protein